MRDYELIDDVLWKQFTSWYPCKKHVFSRKVIEQGEGKRKIRVVELRPPRFHLLSSPSSSFTLSRNDTCATLFRNVGTCLSCTSPVKSLWICGGESVSLPPKSLIPSQWTRVPNDLTTLYEFGIMGMQIPLHVYVGEFPSDSSLHWSHVAST